ncbi:peptide methionine sulfoxide reductase [Lactococcus kimchii]|nr:peptide methionine sulfoxide reductase [Lactococcus sp. S-13]RZI49874.1 peptide methionine sulfoxide reductase [Lactococcus sp. S-13]RZI49902.1 peptide methionine sulfoxide reductase [Lactococcus sp. S-13]
MDFYFYVQSEEQEERIYQQYLHTDMTVSFVEFKKALGYKPLRQSKQEKKEAVTQEEEIKRLKRASQFINFNGEGGKE